LFAVERIRAVTDDGLTVGGNVIGLAVEVPAGDVAQADHAGGGGPAVGFIAEDLVADADDDRAVGGDGGGVAVVVSAGQIAHWDDACGGGPAEAFGARAGCGAGAVADDDVSVGGHGVRRAEG